MADTLSKKPHGILASLALKGWKRASTVEVYDLRYYEDENVALVYNATTTSSLLQYAKETQSKDAELREIWNKLRNDEQLEGWSTNHESFFHYKDRLAIADSPNLLEALMTEVRLSKFAIHIGNTKIYQDIKRQY